MIGTVDPAVTTVARILLIAIPVAFNAAFAALAATFGYPDILRRPTAEILEKFRQGGARLGVAVGEHLGFLGVWSLWLIATGITLLLQTGQP